MQKFVRALFAAGILAGCSGGSSSLTATLPALPPANPLSPGAFYEAWAIGVPCGPAIDFGGFYGP